MIEPISITVGLIVGGTLGAIAAAVFSANQLIELATENAELKAWKSSVLSGLNKASAARKAKRLAEKVLKDANHNSMRATLEMVG